MFYRTDDPVADFGRWDDEQNEIPDGCPECCECGEYIVQDTAVCINEDWYCDDCLQDLRRLT